MQAPSSDSKAQALGRVDLKLQDAVGRLWCPGEKDVLQPPGPLDMFSAFWPLFPDLGPSEMRCSCALESSGT